jgi:hypothetical protein
MIPVRLQYRIQPTEYPVFIVPRIGYIYRINDLPEDPITESGVISAPDGTAFSYLQTQALEEPPAHMLELGVGVALRIAGLWQASLNLSYISGILGDAASSFALDYTDQQGFARTAGYNSKGNAIYTTLSFHIPVSNIWQNKDYRVRSRIENSVYIGKSVERKGQFYAGGELGALWRLFYTDDPALSGRPMEGRGVFRYANFHTGLYAGYMLTQELGVDLGVTYQQSSTFYALMFDHEDDLVASEGAPMYLEVPLRFRYFYDLHEERIYAVVYGGASLLTHFSQEEYSAPGGDFTYTSPATQSEVAATATASVTRLSRYRPLLRLGAGVEYLLPFEFPLFVTGYLNYMQGFQSAEMVAVTTNLPESPGTSALLYHGNGWSLDVGVKVPLSFRERTNCVNLTRKKGKEEQ